MTPAAGGGNETQRCLSGKLTSADGKTDGGGDRLELASVPSGPSDNQYLKLRGGRGDTYAGSAWTGPDLAWPVQGSPDGEASLVRTLSEDALEM